MTAAAGGFGSVRFIALRNESGAEPVRAGASPPAFRAVPRPSGAAAHCVAKRSGSKRGSSEIGETLDGHISAVR